MPVSDYTPDTTDVAAQERARLVDAFGNVTDDFTTDTRPSLAQAVILIEAAADEVSAQIGFDIPPSRFPMAKRAVVLRTVTLIESTYWPEQVHSDRSPYKVKLDEYNALMKVLVAAVENGGAEDQGSGLGDEMDPAYGFGDAYYPCTPPTRFGKIDLETKF